MYIKKDLTSEYTAQILNFFYLYSFSNVRLTITFSFENTKYF